jgi:hypothetical protein
MWQRNLNYERSYIPRLIEWPILTTKNGRIITNREIGRSLKEVVVACFKVLFQNFLEDIWRTTKSLLKIAPLQTRDLHH